jgi:hypothetical protein
VYYAGEWRSGKEAEYLRAATKAKDYVPPPPEGERTLDERIPEMLYEFARLGIQPRDWIKWTFDQAAMFFEQRAKRSDENNRRIADHVEKCRQSKGDPIVRMVIPLEA